MRDYDGSFVPDDEERYERMLKLFRSAQSPEALETVLLLYLFDRSYSRRDLNEAFHLVEREKGFRPKAERVGG